VWGLWKTPTRLAGLGFFLLSFLQRGVGKVGRKMGIVEIFLKIFVSEHVKVFQNSRKFAIF